jgi:hypothetical protein
MWPFRRHTPPPAMPEAPVPPGWSFFFYDTARPEQGPTPSWDNGWDTVRLVHESGFYVNVSRYYDLDLWLRPDWRTQVEQMRQDWLRRQRLTRKEPVEMTRAEDS